MSSTSIGRAAEDAAANFLVGQGYKIIAQNWRKRTCEIDIVASKDNTIYFVEVKYRASDSQGSGLEYITPKKLAQMEYAAKMWVSENNWTESYRLSAIEITSGTFVVTEFIDSLT